MSERSNPDWLVRTAKNLISGPFSADQVRNLILSGQLNLQDEVCQANHYWIFLHEGEEIINQLGVEVPKSIADDEITQTQTQTQTRTQTLSEMDLRLATQYQSQGSQREKIDDEEEDEEEEEEIADDLLDGINEAYDQAAKPAETVSPDDGAEDLPDLAAPAEETDGSTKALSNRAFREFRAPKKEADKIGEATVHGVSQSGSEDAITEKSSFWRLIAWSLIGICGVLVVLVIRLLRES